MWPAIRPGIVLWQLSIAAAIAWADLVYVTDLPLYSSLAPCAATAVAQAINGLTESNCPPAVTALESCACSKDKIPAAVSSTISAYVIYSCGSTASEDLASASKVFDRYCNQNVAASSVAAQPTLVTDYITNLPAYSALAPCAISALSYVVQDLTYTKCPTGPSALASCACSKNQNSLAASESINHDVFASCGSTHTEDVTSAQAVFKGYCGMAAGTTSFPTASGLAGSLTYYITDLPNFSSLAPCAQRSLSYAVLSQTYQYCPADPNALASCVCAKDSNLASLSSVVKTEVTNGCGSTANADVSSALDIFNYYCSAAKGLVTPAGVTASVTVSSGGTPLGSQPSASGHVTAPTSASTAAGSDNSSGNGTSPSSSSSSKSSGAPIGAIVGGIVAGVAVIAVAVIAILLYRRRNNRKAPPPLGTISGPTGSSNSPKDSKSAVELASYTKMSTPPLKGQDLGPGYDVPAHNISEMHTRTSPLPQKANLYEMSPDQRAATAYEMNRDQRNVYEMNPDQRHVYEMSPDQRHVYEMSPEQRHVYEMSPEQRHVYEMQGRQNYAGHELAPNPMGTGMGMGAGGMPTGPGMGPQGQVYEMYSSPPRGGHLG